MWCCCSSEFLFILLFFSRQRALVRCSKDIYNGKIASRYSKIEKFNGQNFNLQKLKMEYLRIGREHKEVVTEDMNPNTVKQEDREKVNDQVISQVGLNLSHFMLINVLEKTTTKKLWDKLDLLYEAKFLMNLIFLWKSCML